MCSRISYRAVNTLPLVYKKNQLILYRKIIAVYTEIYKDKQTHSVGRIENFLMVVYKVTTGLYRVKNSSPVTKPKPSLPYS
jgi:hypothetical protein